MNLMLVPPFIIVLFDSLQKLVLVKKKKEKALVVLTNLRWNPPNVWNFRMGTRIPKCHENQQSDAVCVCACEIRFFFWLELSL